MLEIIVYEISADTKDIAEKTEIRFEGFTMFPHSDKGFLHDVMRNVRLPYSE
jgi:hypothetical protein